MRHLGYIISDKEIVNLPFFIQCRKMDDFTLIKSIKAPLLIIGFDNAKKCLGEKFDILNRKDCDECVRWTFKKTEKRTLYEDDLVSFYSFVIETYKNSIPYYYINPFKLTFSSMRGMINFMKNGKEKKILTYRGMIYIYGGEYVLGIFEESISKLNINKDRVLKWFGKFNGCILSEMNNRTYSSEIRKYLGKNYYLLPCLL